MLFFSQYKVTLAGLDGMPEEMSALCVEYVYPASPPDAQPELTLKFREFYTRKGMEDRLAKQAQAAFRKQLS